MNATLSGLPAPFIDATSQGILTNLVIVWTVIISFFWLGTRYHQIHYIGCILVIMSGLQAVTVEIQTNNPPLGQYTPADGGAPMTASALWYVIYIIGTFP